MRAPVGNITTILCGMVVLSKLQQQFFTHVLALFLSISQRFSFLQLARHSYKYVESSFGCILSSISTFPPLTEILSSSMARDIPYWPSTPATSRRVAAPLRAPASIGPGRLRKVLRPGSRPALGHWCRLSHGLPPGRSPYARQRWAASQENQFDRPLWAGIKSRLKAWVAILPWMLILRKPA